MTVLVIVLCLAVSFIFSGIEAGILSVNRVRLAHRAKQREVAALKLERLLAKPEPWPLWMRDVLDRPIPPLLVLRATVRRTQIERIVGLIVRLQPKREADEAAGARRRVRRGSTGKLCFDDAI